MNPGGTVSPVIEELRPGAGGSPRERPRSGRLLDVKGLGAFSDVRGEG